MLRPCTRPPPWTVQSCAGAWTATIQRHQTAGRGSRSWSDVCRSRLPSRHRCSRRVSVRLRRAPCRCIRQAIIHSAAQIAEALYECGIVRLIGITGVSAELTDCIRHVGTSTDRRPHQRTNRRLVSANIAECGLEAVRRARRASHQVALVSATACTRSCGTCAERRVRMHSARVRWCAESDRG